jgi:protein-disulfide isomerase
MAKESKEQRSSHTPPPEPTGGMNTGVAIIGFILCFLAGAGIMWGYMQRKVRTGEIGAEPSAQAAWDDSESPIPVSSKDPTWGSRTAPVTIVQFSDFQCPFCAKVETTMEQLKSTYGPEKLRIVWKNEPLSFHPNAKPAAEAAQGVFALKGNDAFWKFHDTAFKNQSSLNQENYEKWAQAVGVDLAKFKAGLASHQWAKKVDEDHELAKKVGVSGTPAAYVNGVSVSGAQPFDKFKAVVDAELAKAEAKLKAGTPKDRIYVVMSQENHKAAPPAQEEEGEDTKTVWKVPVGKSPVKGPATALVTIIEFSDFQCPYCKRVEPTLAELEKKYGDKIRLVWKHEPLPFHPAAEPAAQIAMEARAQKGDAGFWAAHDKLFELQGDLSGLTKEGGRDLDPEKVEAFAEKVAKELGLDVGRVKDAVKTHKYKKDIDEDMDLSEDFQASGTPHFFVNGRRLVGAQPNTAFEKIIDEEIGKANAAIQKGTARPETVYAVLTADGKGPPPPERKENVVPPPSAPTKGAANAKVVIQEFSDFQCPFCQRVEATVKQILKDYDGRVKLVWRDKPLPMHPEAPLASEAAREALKQKGPDAFWKMHDLMFENQSKLKREDLEGYAKQVGLDMDKFKAALDNRTHKATVDAESKAADDAGISGTPAFVINGYFISGAQPYGKFRKIIERALAEAK